VQVVLVYTPRRPIPRSTITSGGFVSDIVRLATPIALLALFLWAVAPILAERRRFYSAPAFALPGVDP
jgi:hypothetical protein